MEIDAITSLLHRNSTWELYHSPNNSIKELNPYYQCSIASLSETFIPASKGYEEDSQGQQQVKEKQKPLVRIHNFFSWFFSRLFDYSADVMAREYSIDLKAEKAIGPCPKLEKPIQMDLKSIQRLNEEMRKSNREISGIKETGNEYLKENRHRPKDAALFLTLISCILAQKKSRETTGQLLTDDVVRMHEHNQALIKEYFNAVKEMQKRSKASKIVGWVGAGCLAASLGLFFVSLFTGGLGTSFTVLGGSLSIARAATTATKEGFQYKNNLAKGKLFERKSAREENLHLTKNFTQRLTRANKQTIEYIKTAKEACNSHHRACRSKN